MTTDDSPQELPQFSRQRRPPTPRQRHPVLYFLSILAAHMYWFTWFIVEYLGYPLIPGAVTNDLWELLWIHIKVLGWLLLTFIPVMLLSFITAWLFWLNLRLIEDLVRDIKGVFWHA